MRVIPRCPPIAAFRPVKAVDSWPVRQRGRARAGGIGAPGVPGPVVAAGVGLAVAPLVAGGGQRRATGGPAGLPPEEAGTNRTEKAGGGSTAKAKTGDPPARAEGVTGVLRKSAPGG